MAGVKNYRRFRKIKFGTIEFTME